MSKEYNILQFEFFHASGETLEAVLADCAERSAEHLPLALAGDDTGSGIKTVIRLYDVNGLVTQLAAFVHQLERKRDAYYLDQPKGVIASWYRAWQLRRMQQQINSGRLMLGDFLITYLTKSFKKDWNVARETWRHEFRLANRTEYPEIVAAAKRAKRYWLFIFRPNDLLAAKNESVVYLM